jgi:hypothetical protein
MDPGLRRDDTALLNASSVNTPLNGEWIGLWL